MRPPVITKQDNDSSPVLTIAVTADRPLRELTEIADKIVKPQLERSSGVGEVEIVGGLERAINVWVDADRLAAYNLPITAVRDALSRQNADLPGGNVTTNVREQTLRTMGRVVDPKSFGDLVIATRNGAPIRIRDIGYAEDGTKEQRSLSRLNGVPTVTLAIRRQSGANTVAVIEGAESAARARPGADARRRDARRHPRSVEIHLRGAARNQPAPRARQHPRLPRRVLLHARLARDGHRRRGDSGLGRSRRSA